MIDMTQNDVHTFKEWCDENGFEDVFHDKFNSQHFEMAMIALHEARAGGCVQTKRGENASWGN